MASMVRIPGLLFLVALTFLGCTPPQSTMVARIPSSAGSSVGMARLTIRINGSIQIGNDSIPHAYGNYVEVAGGTYAVKPPGHPEFQWSAKGGEAYELRDYVSHYASGSIIRLYHGASHIVGGDAKVVAGPQLGTEFVLRDEATMYPVGTGVVDAGIEMGEGFQLVGLSGTLSDGRRFSCAEGISEVFYPYPHKIHANACGYFVKAKHLRVLPGKYVAEVLWSGPPYSSGLLHVLVQVDAGDIATITSQFKGNIFGPETLQVAVIKRKAR